ncbi:MAG: BPSS1780 family membrane protein [Gallionellaceae bacterium]|nr:BPSS1780 family membrane protein [Gallionellaceae bacterium]
MNARKLLASDGWLWIKQGNYLFKKSPVLLVTLLLITIAALLVTSRIPLAGDVLIGFLFPIFFVGLMRGCQALENDEELEIAHLFWGFQRAPFLITLGAINIIAESIIIVIMTNTGGKELIDILTSETPENNPAVILAAVQSAGISLPLGIGLFSMLLMAMQFAPMLVAFNNATPLAALKASLRACLRNMAALSVYGVIMLLFAFAATLAMMLGWIILFPIMITSIYAAYRRLFPTAAEMARMASSYNAAQPNSNASNDGL